MKILITPRYKQNLQTLLTQIHQQLDFSNAKNFKLYLDTIIFNIPTKLHKYKTSDFFKDERVKEIDFRGFKIFFLYDKNDEKIILLSIA